MTARLLIFSAIFFSACNLVWFKSTENRVDISTVSGRKTLSKLLGDSIGQPIFLKNPSFESLVGTHGFLPFGWDNLGEKGETPPDSQPNCFGVTQKPAHGETYLGMVVRENGTTESVGQ